MLRCSLTALAFAFLAPMASQPTEAALRAPAPAETVVQETSTHLALGANHSCQLGPDGKVRCWGANSRGQLGDGSTTTRLGPGALPGGGKPRSFKPKHDLASTR